MNVRDFVSDWKASTLNEQQGAKLQFTELCALLGVGTPADPENYCFERGAAKTTGGNGWADVWKRNHFGWEYKRARAVTLSGRWRSCRIMRGR